MMLNNLSMAEYTYWVAYFGVDWTKFKTDQTPDQMQMNLEFSLAARKKGKKK